MARRKRVAAHVDVPSVDEVPAYAADSEPVAEPEPEKKEEKKSTLGEAIAGVLNRAAAVLLGHNWVTGEIITAEKMNELENTAATAKELSETNETDLVAVHNDLYAIGQDTAEGGFELRAGSVGSTALKPVGISISPVGDDTLLVDYVGIPKNKNESISQDRVRLTDVYTYIKSKLTAEKAWVKGEMLGVASSTELGGLKSASGSPQYANVYVDTNNGNGSVFPARPGNSLTTGIIGSIKLDSSQFEFNEDTLVTSIKASVLSPAALALQRGTVVTTFANLRVSDLKSNGGKLAEGVFSLTNGGSADVTVPAETVFLTGLQLDASATQYTCYDVKAGWEPLTLEVNETGKSLNFTTQIVVKAGSTLPIYVVANANG